MSVFFLTFYTVNSLTVTSAILDLLWLLVIKTKNNTKISTKLKAAAELPFVLFIVFFIILSPLLNYILFKLTLTRRVSRNRDTRDPYP